MPTTTPDGLPYETLDDGEPTRTLNGGSSGTADILAIKTQEALTAIRGDASSLDDRVSELEDKVFLLDRVSLSGTVGMGTDLVIPSALRGEFDSYVLEVDAHVSQSLRAFVVRINGLADDNYRAVATAFNTSLSVQKSFNEDGTSFPRFGFFGAFGSFMRAYIRPRSKGETGFVQWTCQGWANEGGASSIMTLAGGRWNGTVQELTHLTVRTAGSGSTSDTWGSSSSATLWGRV